MCSDFLFLHDCFGNCRFLGIDLFLLGAQICWCIVIHCGLTVLYISVVSVVPSLSFLILRFFLFVNLKICQFYFFKSALHFIDLSYCLFSLHLFPLLIFISFLLVTLDFALFLVKLGYLRFLFLDAGRHLLL